MAVGTTAFPTSLDTAVELVEITNNASSTLSGNVLIGDTTIGVTDIGEFPTTGYGTMVDDLTTPTKIEIISWTGKSGSNLTGCTRGAQGTAAAAFSSGNYIEVRPTAGHHEALRGAVIAIETKLGTGSAIAVNKLAALTASRLPVLDASGFLSASSVTATEAGYLSGVTSAIQTQLNAKGAGDVVGPASATGDAVVRFDSTTGKLVKNSAVTIADTTGNMAGVGTLNTHTIPGGTDTFVMLAANQTLTTKTLTSPDINGGTADSLTSLSVRSTGAAFDLLFANTEVLTGNKTLTFKVNDASRTVDLAGNLTLAAAFSTSGANALTLTTTGATNVTLPTSGTLVNSAVTSLSSLTTVGTITSGGLGTGAVLGGVTVTLGSDADGDIYYRSSNVLTRLAKGTALQRLRMNAGATAPEWFTDSGGGGITIGTTAITSGTAGRILYETAANLLGEIAGSSVTAGGQVTLADKLTLTLDNATTNASDVLLDIQHSSSGTPAASFGSEIRFGLESTTTTNQDAGAFGVRWTTATHASRRSEAYLKLYDGTSSYFTPLVFRTINAGGNGVELTNPNGSGLLYLSANNGGGAFLRLYPNYVYLGSASSWAFWQNNTATGNPIFQVNNSKVGINVGAVDTAPAAMLQIISSAAGTIGLRVDSAATPSTDIVQFTNNGSNRWALNSSTTATTATVSDTNGGTQVRGTLTESVTLSTSGTTTDTTINLPANSIILSVTGRITTTITTATDWKLGDATVADRFSDANATLTSGTTTVGINQWKADRTTAGQGAFQQSTAKVRITTTGTPGAGVIRITIHYITLTAPTS